MIYAVLAEGRDEQQLLALDRALAPSTEDADALIAKANMAAMQQLQGQLGELQPGRSR